jgi:hypothetical protein
MRLLDEIIDAAADEKVPIGTLLRKCLVLQQQVKNEKFRAWLDRELDGYNQRGRHFGRPEPHARIPHKELIRWGAGPGT